MNNQSENTVDVLISGAGPTGLMLVLLLSKEKISFRIIEQDSAPHKESRAILIQARSLELFQSTGLIDNFLEAGTIGTGVSVFVKGNQAAKINFSDIGRDDSPYPHLLFLSQSVTESILEEALTRQGIKIERQTSLEGFEQNADGITAKLKRSDGTLSILSARYLVGCDGARSQVRKFSHLEFGGGTYDSEFMLADAKIHWDLPLDRFLVLLGEENLGLIMPLKGSNISRVITIGDNKESTETAKTNLTTKTTTTIEEVEKNLQKVISRNVKLTDAQWVTSYRVHHRSVDSMKVGRVFLAGDAAHIHSPAGGQGMNTGLQDASNLAWKLGSALRGEASTEILETYNSERLRVAKKLLNVTDRFFSAAVAQPPLAKKFRNFMIPFVGQFLMNSRIARRFMFGFISQLNIRYHQSLAVQQDIKGGARGKKIHAGCRAPNAKLSGGQSIFEMIKGYKWSLIVMSRTKINPTERQQFKKRWQERNLFGTRDVDIIWIDGIENSEALKVYQVDNVLVSLIRPDGYIGFQADHLI